MVEMYKGWKTVETRVLRRTGRWVLGLLVQEDENSKRRVKLFKGVITPKGHVDVPYKDETLKVSLIQRINIPNKKYWINLNKKIIPILTEYFDKSGQKTMEEFK